MKASRGFAGALVGMLFGLFVGLDLVVFGVVALDSAVITVLAGVGLVGGCVLAVLAAGRAAAPAVTAAPPMTMASAPPPPPMSSPPPPPPMP